MRLFLPLITLAILGCCVGLSYFLFALGPAANNTFLKDFEINGGQGLEEISANLKTAGLIRSKNAFRLYAIISGKAHLLKPGEYVLDSASGTPALLGILVRGPKEEIRVTIIEGMSLRDIEEKLSAAGILPEKAISQFDFADLKKDYEFLANAKSLEGYLFPDTYNFFQKSNPQSVIRKFLDNFKKKAWPYLKNNTDFHKKLILASLVEREVPFTEDRQLVAGILLKRLTIGIPLQIDATISYIKCSGTFIFCDNPAIKKEEINLASPFNTYLHYGLPPGPISNPGLGAIMATLNPKKSEYLYYLSDPKTKKTIFSKTLDEHNENRAKYLGL